MTGIQELLNAGGNVSITLTAPQLKELAKEITAQIQQAAPANQQKPQQEIFYTREQVLQILSICDATLYNWSRKGFLQPIKVGGLNRYRKSDIDKLTGSAGK